MCIEFYAVYSKRINFLGYKISIFERCIAEYEELLEDSWNIKLFLNGHFVVDSPFIMHVILKMLLW